MLGGGARQVAKICSQLQLARFRRAARIIAVAVVAVQLLQTFGWQEASSSGLLASERSPRNACGMPAGVWQQPPRIPPLHASRADTIVTGSSREPELCRICWEAADSDAHGRLIAPCVCRGSMVRRRRSRSQLVRLPHQCVHIQAPCCPAAAPRAREMPPLLAGSAARHKGHRSQPSL
jgi:hypothetical protein